MPPVGDRGDGRRAAADPAGRTGAGLPSLPGRASRQRGAGPAQRFRRRRRCCSWRRRRDTWAACGRGSPCWAIVRGRTSGATARRRASISGAPSSAMQSCAIRPAPRGATARPAPARWSRAATSWPPSWISWSRWLVVALGRVALGALGRLAPHDLALGVDPGRVVAWRGRRLTSLYHPSGQTLGRRSRAQQVDDYQAVARSLRRLERASATGPGRGRRRAADCSSAGLSIS